MNDASSQLARVGLPSANVRMTVIVIRGEWAVPLSMSMAKGRPSRNRELDSHGLAFLR